MPDVFILDDNGYLHQNHMEIATMFSLATNQISIGVAKTFYNFAKIHFALGNNFLDVEPIIIDNQIYGYAMRSRENCNQIFISPGNKLGFQNYIDIVKMCLNNESRILIPTRVADLDTHLERRKVLVRYGGLIMPGYYVHLAVSNQKTRQNRSFVYGVETPDLLKKYLKLYGLDGAREKYNSIKTLEMPDFSYFESRVQQQENNLGSNGMHYGWSSNPNVMCYWDSLTKREKQNPFYIGYLWHLLTDLFMYKYLDMESKLGVFAEQHKDDKNISELMKIEYKKLHSDWDKTNAKIRSNYPDVILTPEVLELDVVKFINDDQFAYVDWNIIKTIIDYMRTINPLDQDINRIIDEIMFFLPEHNDYSIGTLNKRLILSRLKK